jgi:hypothetical protein
MSTSLRLRLLTLLTVSTLACGPAFPRADERECSLQPTPPPCQDCGISMQEVLRPRVMAGLPMDRPVLTVTEQGWGPMPLPGWTPSFEGLLDATDDEVLALGARRQSVLSVSIRTGEVRHLTNLPLGMSWRWGRGPQGFWLVAHDRLIPSSPQAGPHVVRLPAPLPFSLAPSERPLDTLSTGALLVPTSMGLLDFDPRRAGPSPLTVLARGAFTSAVLLGTEVYAARCEPRSLPTQALLFEATAVVTFDSACEVVRLPEGRQDGVTVVTRLSGLFELAPFRDRLVARAHSGLYEVTRDGRVRLLYLDEATHPDGGTAPAPRVGPLQQVGEVITFRQDSCLVRLDDDLGTSTVSALPDDRSLLLHGRLFSVSAPSR